MFAALSLITLVALPACDSGGSNDPLAQVDREYSEIVHDLAIADRDNTRNRNNKEARREKIKKEQERVAFFNNTRVIASIEEARTSTAPSVAAKGEAYWRHAVYIRSWTQEEKALETDLLAKIEDLRSREASWSGAEGAEISIKGRWNQVSENADTLSQEDREEYATVWLENRQQWLDDDLSKLIKLRNEVAHREDFTNYWELSLYHHGLDPADVKTFLDEVQSIVAPVNKAAAKTVAATAKKQKLSDSFANSELLRREAGLILDEREAEIWFDTDNAEEIISRSLRDMGFDTSGIQVYTGPSRYTRSGAYSFAIEPPEYLAVVVSVDHRKNIWPYRALAHEMGRALWWRHLPESHLSSPMLWEPPAAYLEGFGQFFERTISEPKFASLYLRDMPEEMRTQIAEAQVQSTLNTLTWYLGSTRIEQQMYENPGDWSALTQSAAALEKEIRGWAWDAPQDSEGRAYSSFLESGIMMNYPGYVQNFLYQQAVSAALFDATSKAVGAPVGNDKVAGWLTTELINKVGPTMPFEKRLSELSGGEAPTAALKRYLE